MPKPVVRGISLFGEEGERPGRQCPDPTSLATRWPRFCQRGVLAAFCCLCTFNNEDYVLANAAAGIIHGSKDAAYRTVLHSYIASLGRHNYRPRASAY